MDKLNKTSIIKNSQRYVHQEEISVASSLDKNCGGSNCHDIQDNSYKERLPEVACSNGNVSSSVLDGMRQSSRLVVPLVDVDKVRCIIRNIVRDWATEGQSERDQCYKPILEELEGLFPTRSKDSPPSCLVPGAGLGRLALEISRLGFICQGNEFSYYMMICSNFILNCTRAAEEWTLYPWIHSNNNSLSDEDQLRPVAIPDILPYSAGITEGFSMCGGDFVEVYTDPSQQGFWDAVVTCFFIDTAHNIVEYIEIIWKILKDGGVWINLGPLLYHFADAYGLENVVVKTGTILLIHLATKWMDSRHSKGSGEDAGVHMAVPVDPTIPPPHILATSSCLNKTCGFPLWRFEPVTPRSNTNVRIVVQITLSKAAASDKDWLTATKWMGSRHSKGSSEDVDVHMVAPVDPTRIFVCNWCRFSFLPLKFTFWFFPLPYLGNVNRIELRRCEERCSTLWIPVGERKQH